MDNAKHKSKHKSKSKRSNNFKSLPKLKKITLEQSDSVALATRSCEPNLQQSANLHTTINSPFQPRNNLRSTLRKSSSDGSLMNFINKDLYKSDDKNIVKCLEKLKKEFICQNCGRPHHYNIIDSILDICEKCRCFHCLKNITKI